MKKFAQISVVGLLALSFVMTDAQAAKKKEGADVAGIVRDESGKPVTNATVRMLHRGEDGKLHEVDSDETNEDGEFRFEDVNNATYVVVAMSGRRTLRDRTTVTVKGKTVDPINFTLRKGEEEAEERSAKRDANRGYSNLRGTVRDADGDLMKNAKVRLLTGDNDPDSNKLVEVDTVTTDNKGRFQFTKVANGNYFVEIADGKKGSRKTVTLRAGDTPERVDLKTK